MRRENYRGAARFYGEALKRSPKFFPALIEGALAHGHLGEVAVARDWLSRARDSAKGNSANEVGVASGYFKISEFGVAREILEGLWERERKDEVGIALAELCERTGDLTRGLEALGGVKLPRAELLRGILMRRSGDWSAARRSFERAFGGTGDGEVRTRYRAGLELGRCYENGGEYERAWDTMLAAKALVGPGELDARKLDRQFERSMKEGLASYEGWKWIESEVNGISPYLLSGHPRSGTSVCALHLANDLKAQDIDEIGSFARVMDAMRLSGVPPQKLKRSKTEQFRSAYREKMRAFMPELNEGRIWLDKNPGLERFGAYWLKVFPNSKIYLVRRNLLDTVISCLFTYVGLNCFSYQFFDAERAAKSVEWSLCLQDKLIEKAPGAVEVIDFEDFLSKRLGQEVNSDGRVLHSPNYGEALKPLHGEAIGRWEGYQDLLPKELVARFGK